jgi:hypothetical protein
MIGKRMKAASLIFEQALLFAFGVIIFISCIAAFNNYQSYFNSVGAIDQLTEVSEYIGSNIIKMSERPDEESSIKVQLPKKIASEIYVIELSSDGLNVTTSDTKTCKTSALFNLNQTFGMSGRVVSTAGNMIIIKSGNQIIIK